MLGAVTNAPNRNKPTRPSAGSKPHGHQGLGALFRNQYCRVVFVDSLREYDWFGFAIDPDSSLVAVMTDPVQRHRSALKKY
jgi:hypothetical protein